MSGHKPWKLIKRLAQPNPGMKICKVCFKLYNPEVGWQMESHMHQGQGPSDLNK